MTSTTPPPEDLSSTPSPADPPPPLSIVPPAYLRELKLHLQTEEPELWQWFVESSAKADEAENTGAEIELLKSAIRLAGGPHAVVTAEARLLGARLGLDDEIEVYQSIDEQSRNARVLTFGAKIHIVFSGDLLDLLDDTEQRVVLLHELAHVVLWRFDDGDFRVLDAMIHRLDDESVDQPIAESARRVRLHTEVWADSVALRVLQDLPSSISTLMKVSSGLRHVDPDAYLRQAERILTEDAATSSAHTHPDHHVRVACLALPFDVVGREDQIARLIEGPDDLDTIDLLGQLRVQSIVDTVLVGGAAAIGEAAATTGVNSYLARYPSHPAASDQPAPPVDGALSEAQPSIRHLAAAILVDMVMTDDSLSGLDQLRSLSREADRVGVAAEFDKVLSKATERTVAEARRLRDEVAI